MDANRRQRRVEAERLAGGEKGEGTEKTAEAIRLHYPEFDRFVDGLMLIKPRTEYEMAAKYELDLIVMQWRDLLKTNTRRREDGKETMNLPGTVRLFEGDNESGVLMTDITKGGTLQIQELKVIEFGQIPGMWLSDWRKIRKKIDQDLRVAEEEGVLLGGGPSKLDSWLLSFDPSTREWDVTIVDIGRHAGGKASPGMVAKRNDEIRKQLNQYQYQLEQAEAWN